MLGNSFHQKVGIYGSVHQQMAAGGARVVEESAGSWRGLLAPANSCCMQLKWRLPCATPASLVHTYHPDKLTSSMTLTLSSVM